MPQGQNASGGVLTIVLGGHDPAVDRWGGSMTTWRSPRLDVGQFGLPWPAVLVNSWQLTARTDEPADLSLLPVRGAEDWDLLVPHPSASLSLDPEDGLVLHLGSGSLTPLYLDRTQEPGWDQTVQVLGRAIVATTDLGGYWRRIREGRGAPQFADVFSPDSEAMLVESKPAN